MENNNPNVENKPKLSNAGNPPSIRTYQADVADAVNNEKASVVTIAIAEAKKRERDVQFEQDSTFSGKNMYLIGLSIFLIVAGIGLSLFFYLKQSGGAVTTKVVSENPLLIIDSTKNFDITALQHDKILGLLETERATSPAKAGSIEEITLSALTGTEQKKLNTGDFLTTLSQSVPDALIRALDPHFVFGLHLFRKNEPFLILTVNSYQSAFANMLEWEEQMFYDFGSLFLTEPHPPEPR